MKIAFLLIVYQKNRLVGLNTIYSLFRNQQ